VLIDIAPVVVPPELLLELELPLLLLDAPLLLLDAPPLLLLLLLVCPPLLLLLLVTPPPLLLLLVCPPLLLLLLVTPPLLLEPLLVDPLLLEVPPLLLLTESVPLVAAELPPAHADSAASNTQHMPGARIRFKLDAGIRMAFCSLDDVTNAFLWRPCALAICPQSATWGLCLANYRQRIASVRRVTNCAIPAHGPARADDCCRGDMEAISAYYIGE
jgi:hypothetical protein